ncbi:hypothetical protein QWY79_10315 [Halomonas sabkhae]|uniref:hypothetical protein n=1 Tax=Halomonas sabkhae TaxID=626223 RepID=UPI0025B50E6B|nr:hypothetical protein [Halomonas sabkhae]MDN3525657.1 hypothetical protein [Halomonas sabkhae]
MKFHPEGFVMLYLQLIAFAGLSWAAVDAWHSGVEVVAVVWLALVPPFAYTIPYFFKEAFGLNAHQKRNRSGQ